MGLTFLICLILVLIDFPIAKFIVVAIIFIIIAIFIIADKGCEKGWEIIWKYYPLTILLVLIIFAIFDVFIRYVIVLYISLVISLFWLIHDYDCDKWYCFPIVLCTAETVCTIICIIFGANQFRFFSSLLETLLAIDIIVCCLISCIQSCTG